MIKLIRPNFVFRSKIFDLTFNNIIKTTRGENSTLGYKTYNKIYEDLVSTKIRGVLYSLPNIWYSYRREFK